MRFQVIMFKTLKDLFSIRRSLLFIIGVMIVPLVAGGMFSGGDGAALGDMTLAMQNQMVLGLFIILTFMWMAGIPLVLLASVTCGDFISKEDGEGTLLLLVSKPVARSEIIIGKFLAFMVSAILLQMIVLLMSSLLMASTMHLDVYVFNNMLSLIPSLIMYSVFVSFIFGTIATALSSLFKSRIKTIMTLVGITILIFFGFMMIRGWLGSAYEGYYINYMDVNYHLGNSYLFFVESGGLKLIPIYQGIMGQFTGTYDAADINKLFDRDIGALPPALEPKSYNTPAASLAIWTFLALALLGLGIYRFQRKEIS
ncbi:MAG: ABC transporter permease subunit [Candidatus Aenigmarchaeota archaeon]|nr:ABC transporter permease subunit [Candidatus Aenigmarchaeota archaeon]